MIKYKRGIHLFLLGFICLSQLLAFQNCAKKAQQSSSGPSPSNNEAFQIQKIKIDDSKEFIQLSWAEKHIGNVSYNIYRSSSENGPWELIGSAEKGNGDLFLFRDTKVKAWTNYFYTVSAIFADGKESMRSKPVQGVPGLATKKIDSDGDDILSRTSHSPNFFIHESGTIYNFVQKEFYTPDNSWEYGIVIFASDDGGKSYYCLSKIPGIYVKSDKKNYFVSSNKYIYIASSDNIFISKDEGKSFTTIAIKAYSRPNILVDSKERIYLYGNYDKGVSVSSDGGISFVKFLDGLTVYSLSKYQNGEILAGTNKGLYRSTSDNLELKKVTGVLGDEPIWNIAIVGNFALVQGSTKTYISVDRGVNFEESILNNDPTKRWGFDGLIFDAKTKTLIYYASSLNFFSWGFSIDNGRTFAELPMPEVPVKYEKYPNIETVYYDSNNSLNLLTSSHSYYGFKHYRLSSIYTNDGIRVGINSKKLAGHLNYAVRKSNGKLYLGTTQGLMTSNDGGQNLELNLDLSTPPKEFSSKPSIEGIANVSSLLKTSRDVVFVVTNNRELYRENYYGIFEKIEPVPRSQYPSYVSEPITKIYIDKYDSLYVLDKYQGLLVSFDLGKTFTRREIPTEVVKNSFISDLCLDARGDLVIKVNDRSVWKQEAGNNFSLILSDNSLVGPIYCDTGGRILFNTYNSLYVSDQNGKNFKKNPEIDFRGYSSRIEKLPDGKIVINGSDYLFFSDDGGATFYPKGKPSFWDIDTKNHNYSYQFGIGGLILGN